MSKTIDCLNEAFRRDPGAIHALMTNRVPCNKELADDPFVVVSEPMALFGRQCIEVSTLGVINGVLVANGLKEVAALWSDLYDNGRPVLLGFCEYKPAEPIDIKRDSELNG